METNNGQIDQSNASQQRIEYLKQRLIIAKEKGNKTEVVQAYVSLAESYFHHGDCKQAMENFNLALSIAKEIGNRNQEGVAVGNLGVCYEVLGDYKQAVEYQKLSLSIAKEVGNRHGEGQMCGGLGNCYHGLGDYKQAVEYHKQSLSYAKEVGNRLGEGQAYGGLGNCYQGLGDYKQAVEYHKRSLSIAKEIGNRYGEGQAYGGLGNCFQGLGDYKLAVKYHKQSLSIVKEVGNRHGEGVAVGNLGVCYQVLGYYKHAVEYHKLSLSIAKEVGNRHGEGQTYGDLGNCYESLGDYKQAVEYHKQSLSIAKEVGNRQGEGKAYGGLGNCYEGLGDYKQAVEYHKQVLSIAKEVGNRNTEGVAYLNLGVCYQGLGDSKQALDYYKLSLSITKEVGHKPREKELYAILGKLCGVLGEVEQAMKYNKLYLYIGETAGVERTGGGLQFGDIAGGEHTHHSVVPNEIKARGPRAKLAYENALKNGKVKVYLARIMFIGQARAGKTSLKKSLLGMPFDPEEQSTVGIEVDPSSFKVDVDQVKNWQRTDEKLGVPQFAQELARMAAGELDKEEAKVDLKAHYVLMERSHTNQVPVNEDKTYNSKDSVIPSSPEKVEEAAAVNDHDDRHTDEKGENAAKVPQLKIDPTLPPKEFTGENAARVLQLKIDPSLPPEEFTQFLIQYLEGLNLHTDTPSTEAAVILDLWDFAGQHLYYASHPVFLSRRAIYLLVCNLSKGLNDTAEPYVRQGIHNLRLENRNGQTNLDDLLSWLVSVSATCPTKQGAAEKELPYLRPPVFIVGTHADKPDQDIEEMKLQVQKEISGKDYGSHVIPVYIPIDNTRSSSDAGVQELKKEMMKVLKQEPYMGEEVPVRWFNFKKVLQALVAENTFFLNVEQLRTIAQKVCLIESEDEFDVMLDFYHDLGQIIKHRSTIVLQAQWLIDLFKQLITIPRCKEMNAKDRKDWEYLQKKGVLQKTLIDNVFSKFIHQGLVKKDILDMMERFGLIAKFSPSPHDVKYFVPAQLESSPTNLREMKPSPSDPCPLYLNFLNGFVPHGIFYQLVSRCIHWCSAHGFKRPPTLFCNGARFFIEKAFFYQLILFCKNRFIKIVLRQIKPVRETPSSETEEVPVLVKRLLEQSLKDLSGELISLKNLKYEFCVACPYCPEEEKSCDKHDQTSCVHEDCLCLLKMVPAERLICEESFSDEMRMVPGLEKWLPSEDEKDRTQNSSQEVLVQPGTLKTGQPSSDDLQHLSSVIYGSWKVLGRLLKLNDSQLLSIDLEELGMYEKCYRMLRKWTQAEGALANYETLSRALEHKLVDRRDLASKYCYLQDDAEQSLDPAQGCQPMNGVLDCPNPPIRSGRPSNDDLQRLAGEIGDCWKKLGRQLKLTEPQLTGIDREEVDMYEKCYRMLMKWTQTYSSDADFETLARALEHNVVLRKDLASKLCYVTAKVFQDLRQMRHDVGQVTKGTDFLLDLKMAALDKGYRISDNHGFGNCLFYALSEQLKVVKGIEIQHKELRSKLVEYLERNPKMPDGTDLANFVDGCQSWADYLAKMKQDGTWGDHVILHAAANCFETCIHVVSSLCHGNDVIITPNRHVEHSNPLMLGHVHEIHYVSLQPIRDHPRKRTSVGQKTEECAKRQKRD